MNDTVTKKVQEIIGNYKHLKEQVNEISDWDSLSEIIRNISTIHDFIRNLIGVVEIAALELTNVKSDDKLNAAVVVLDKTLKLPIWLEFVDGIALKIILSLIVDVVNKEYGHKWYVDLMKKALDEGFNIFDLFDKKN